MLFSKDLIKKFQALHLEKFGIEVTCTVAELQLKELAEIVRLTSKSVEVK